jgi:hypothetical protein
MAKGKYNRILTIRLSENEVKFIKENYVNTSKFIRDAVKYSIKKKSVGKTHENAL